MEGLHLILEIHSTADCTTQYFQKKVHRTYHFLEKNKDFLIREVLMNKLL